MAERTARVLVVDDDSHICEILNRFLSERGFDVQTAADGEEALKSVPVYQPDVVLLDIRMPKMDGIEALEKIVEGGFDCGVIMISGEADLDVAKNTLTTGAADFIYKPFDLDYLETSLLAKLWRWGARRFAHGRRSGLRPRCAGYVAEDAKRFQNQGARRSPMSSR